MLSNALAAVFKRAQANQRCQGGSASAAEGRHVATSIIVDPTVSHVMREAGFSSADEVQANVVEKAISSNMASDSTASPNTHCPKESQAKA